MSAEAYADLLDLIRRYGETYRTHGPGFSNAGVRRMDRQALDVFDEIEAAVAALHEQLARTRQREAQHARIVVEVERIAGDLDGTGPVDGGEVAAALRAAYRAGVAT